MSEELDETRFAALCDLHGGDLSAWPADLREEARALAGRSAAAAAALGAAAELDAALAAGAAAETALTPPEALMARILADAAAESVARAARSAPPQPSKTGAGSGWLGEFVALLGGWRSATAGLAACAAIGFAAGYASPDGLMAALGAADDATVDIGWSVEAEDFDPFGDAS